MLKNLFKYTFLFIALTSVFAIKAKAERVISGENVNLQIRELPAEKDDLYAGDEVLPLDKKISEKEQAQENNSDIDEIDDEYKLPDLMCDSEKLKKQVEDFIYAEINKKSTNSVIKKRERLLLVNNFHTFKDVTTEKIVGKNSIAPASTVAYLRINENRNIYRICKSEGNTSASFENLYIVIYPYVKYYKVVVTNLMNSTDDIEKCTFIYNW